MTRDYELPYNLTAESAMRVYYRNMHIILRQCENEEDPDRLKRLLYDLRICARKDDMLCTLPPDEVINPMGG